MDDDDVVYGGDIPEEYTESYEMEHDQYEEDGQRDQVNDSHPGQNTVSKSQLEEMRKRINELEEETAAMREMQAKVERDMGVSLSSTPSQQTREDADSRSVFVNNVDYYCTPEDLRLHFLSCGTINRITIKTDKYGQPKGYAYVEFLEPVAVQRAVALNESELRNRKIKVTRKRTNFPGLKPPRGRVFHPSMAYPRRPFNPYVPTPARYRPNNGYGRTGGSFHRYNPYG